MVSEQRRDSGSSRKVRDRTQTIITRRSQPNSLMTHKRNHPKKLDKIPDLKSLYITGFKSLRERKDIPIRTPVDIPIF